MVTKGYRKIFSKRENLYIMLNLRFNGFSIGTLANMFGCQERVIRIRCRDYGVKPMTQSVYDVGYLAKKPILEFSIPIQGRADWAEIQGEKICLGRKHYADYFN